MLTIDEIKEITNGKIINGNKETKIDKYCVSRDKHHKNEFFIPVTFRGDRQQYILDAVNAGAIGFMISPSFENYDYVIKKSLELNPNLCIIEVPNINDAIYSLGMYIRNKNIDIPIIAVTGSVGKTSTCEMISSILKQEKNVLSDTGNNNTNVFLSWLLLEYDKNNKKDIAVLEAGMGSKNTISPISKLLQPSICVINNIGTAHIEKLGSKENILKEKLKITEFIKDDKILFLNKDDEMLRNIELEDVNVIKYSINEAKNIKEENGNIEFELNIYNENTKIHINTYGKHNILNAIVAIRIAEHYKIKKDNIIKGLESYKNVDRRFAIKENNKKNIIIDDTYNASFDSMKAGLITASNMTAKRKIAVLGEMLELGDYSESMHSQVGNVFKDAKFDKLYTQGENTKYLCQSANKYISKDNIKFYINQEDLINDLISDLQEGDLIYLKASKKMKFNNIVNKLLFL